MNDVNNPYAAPDSSNPTVGATDDGQIVVDGDMIRVGNWAHLPPVCVITGDTDDLVEIKKTVSYAGPVVLIVFVLSPLIGLILYMILRKKTDLTLYMSRSLRSKRRWKSGYGALSLIASIVIFIGLMEGGQADDFVAILIVPFALLFAGLVLIFMGTALVSVKRFEKPGTFWLKGFKGPFFSALAEGAYNVSPAGF